jgi:uncharacterized protein YjbI with pentapeptide repeats
MTKTLQWKEFENRVAAVYRDLGAIDVSTDVNIAGNQVDVVTKLPQIDGTYLKYIISCKHYADSAGIETVKEWSGVFEALKATKDAEVAVIISLHGFTRPARELADKLNIKLLSIEQLEWANTDLLPYLTEQRTAFCGLNVFKHDRYVPVRLRHETTRSVVFSSDLVHGFLSDADSHLLIVLGDFGAGKTTLSQHLFLSLADAKLTSPPAATRTPIYLNLRGFSGNLNLRNLLLDELVNIHSARCSNYNSLRRLMMAGRLVLILDGFDEMASRTSLQSTIRNYNEILSLCTDNNKLIVTSRTHFFKSQSEVHELAATGTELLNMSRRCVSLVAIVEPFSEPDIELYVNKSCPADAAVVLKGIKETYDLFGLARRPILLQMITEVLPALISSGQQVNAATLYAQYVDSWLKRDDWRVTLDRMQRQSFTQAFALKVYLANKSKFGLDELHSAVKAQFSDVSVHDLNQYEHDVRTCSFIRRDDDDKFEFVHQSFVEYFVSCNLYRDIARNDKELLSTHEFSKEVMQFLAEHLGTRELRTILRDWLSSTNSSILCGNVLPLLQSWEKKVTGDFPRMILQGYSCNQMSFSDVSIILLEVGSASFRRTTFSSFKVKEAYFTNVEWHESTAEQFFVESGVIEAFTVSNCDLTLFHIVSSDIDQMFLKGNRLKNCELRENEVSNSNFSDGAGTMRFYACNVKQSIFDKWGVDFESSIVSSCQFSDCDFVPRRIVGGQFIDCRFKGCTFDIFKMQGAVFRDCTFEGDTKFLTSDARGDGGQLKLKHPPEFYGISGLSAEVIGQLNKVGAVWKPESEQA